MGRGKIILNGVEYGGVDIASELSSTSTNNEAAGAKAVYDELSALNTELGNKVTSSQFSTALKTKVSVVEGKGLSTNDYTNDEKTKLAGLQNTTVDSALSTTSANPVQNKIVTAELNKKANSTDVATALQAKVSVVNGKGLSTNDYTTAEKEKLAGLSNTVIDSALSATSTNPVQNKVVNTALSNKVDKVSGKGLSTNDYTTAEKNKLAGLETYVASQVAAAGHLTKLIVTTLPTVANAKENVIYMIKNSTASGDAYKEYMKIGSAIEQIGDTSVDLSSYAKTADMNTALAKKVNAVSGKGLSTNDYTTAEKNKLAGLSNTTVDSALSTTSTNPVQNKIVTAELNKKANSADVNTALAKKVDVVSGKGLSTNDYTTAEKNKLAGLSNTVVDSALSTTSTNPVQNKIVTAALNGKAASSHTHNYAGSSSAGGVATSAAKLATARTIALSGDVSGSTTFDGSGNASIEASLADEISVDKLYIGSKKAQIYESSTGPTSYSLYIQPAKKEDIYLVNGSHYTIAGYSTSKGVILGEMSKYLDVGIYGKTITVDGPVTFKSDITCANLTATSRITAPGASYSTLGLVKLNDYTTITDSTGLALPATEKNPNISGSLANQISHLNTDLGRAFLRSLRQYGEGDDVNGFTEFGETSYSPYVSNIPITTYGLLYGLGNNDWVTQLAITADSIPKLFVRSNINDAGWCDWKQIGTSSIFDTEKVGISIPRASSVDFAFYVVKNGICFVNVHHAIFSDLLNREKIVFGLPKTLYSCSCLCYNYDDCTVVGTAGMNANDGIIWLKTLSKNSSVSFYFSYPVSC